MPLHLWKSWPGTSFHGDDNATGTRQWTTTQFLNFNSSVVHSPVLVHKQVLHKCTDHSLRCEVLTEYSFQNASLVFSADIPGHGVSPWKPLICWELPFDYARWIATHARSELETVLLHLAHFAQLVLQYKSNGAIQVTNNVDHFFRPISLTCTVYLQPSYVSSTVIWWGLSVRTSCTQLIREVEIIK